jgi:RNA polymerase sigma factor (sigma-70 family)
LSHEAGPALEDPGPSQEERLRRGAEAEELRQAVLGLSEDLRLTVTARFWGELPVKEIARLEGITPVAVRKRLRRAFELLRTDLEGGLR